MKFNLEKIREMGKLVRDLSIGLVNLNFNDNFEGFEKELVIPATSELQIRNNLTFIPTSYIILSQEGNGLITKSNTWSKDFLYLTNNGSVEVTLKIVFLK